nr:hypothetical protein [Tanacetum cinerariifolium]
MEIKGIAKVSRRWFLGCDYSFDCRGGEEDNKQCRVNVHWREKGNLDNSTSNILIPLDSWTSGLLVYRLPLSGFKDLNAEFKEYNNNSSNGVNAASSSVFTAGQNSIDSTNDFSAARPSNAAMPNLEDLSHDVDNVGAEADINNLESIILVSPIPTTKIHKDHPSSQIIGDLFSTTQTRSMARAVRDQGGISQMFNEDF